MEDQEKLLRRIQEQLPNLEKLLQRSSDYLVNFKELHLVGRIPGASGRMERRFHPFLRAPGFLDLHLTLIDR